MPVEDRWLSVDDLMEYLGVSRDTIYDWLVKKALPGHKVGRLWKFKRDEVDAWVKNGHAAAVPVKSNDEPEITHSESAGDEPLISRNMRGR